MTCIVWIRLSDTLYFLLYDPSYFFAFLCYSYFFILDVYASRVLAMLVGDTVDFKHGFKFHLKWKFSPETSVICLLKWNSLLKLVSTNFEWDYSMFILICLFSFCCLLALTFSSNFYDFILFFLIFDIKILFNSSCIGWNPKRIPKYFSLRFAWNRDRKRNFKPGL